MNTLQTAEQHIQPYRARQIDNTLLDHLLQTLPQLEAAGLVTSSDDLCSRFNATVREPKSPSQARLFILTCDRKGTVNRLLRSILAIEELGGFEALYLLDDSRDQARAEDNRQVLETFTDKIPLPLRYFGALEKSEMLEELRGRLPENPEALHYLLDTAKWSGHCTYGLSRNWALLLSAGRRCLMLDDDVLCEAYYPPYARHSLQFCSTSVVDIFASEAAWRQEAHATEIDPLNYHLQYLGNDLGNCLQRFDDRGLTPQALMGMPATDLELLAADAPILISENGSWGDPGCPIHPLLLNSAQPNIERILQADPDLSLSFGKRQLRAINQCVKIARQASISQMTGLDCSRMLPPYFPAFRGEDGVFGWTVQHLYPESRVLTFNWGTPHLPVDSRTSSYHEEPVVPPVDIGAIRSYLESHLRVDGKSTPQTRLNLLAAVLRELADKPTLELVAHARYEAQRAPAAVYARAAERLPYFTGHVPAFEQYLNHAAQTAQQLLQNPPPLAQRYGMQSQLDDAAVVRHIASACGEFAEALEQWPQLWELAQEISG
ncbi:MAG: hypothetical protein AAGI11_14920 [Pseudomonadota bacterium]